MRLSYYPWTINVGHVILCINAKLLNLSLRKYDAADVAAIFTASHNDVNPLIITKAPMLNWAAKWQAGPLYLKVVSLCCLQKNNWSAEYNNILIWEY